ncbi:MAG: hypothetical protein S4CHLAM6_08550 [Chlamydiae bacterium]|nr:hypothetical protein [Chlamydiota bacterium]
MDMRAVTDGLSSASASMCEAWEAGNGFFLQSIESNPDAVAALGSTTAVVLAAASGHLLTGAVAGGLEALGLQTSILAHSKLCGSDEIKAQDQVEIVNKFLFEVPARDYELLTSLALTVLERGASLLSDLGELGSSVVESGRDAFSSLVWPAASEGEPSASKAQE